MRSTADGSRASERRKSWARYLGGKRVRARHLPIPANKGMHEGRLAERKVSGLGGAGGSARARSRMGQATLSGSHRGRKWHQ